MKSIVFVTVLFVSIIQSPGINASESERKISESSISICDNTKSLFPIFGVSLGRTTEKELSELGERHERYNYYSIRGHNFWIQNGVFNHMLIPHTQEAPKKWRNMGFSWYLSYEQVYKLFNCLGFNVAATENPEVVEYNGYNSFNAVLTATKQTEGLEVVLNFKYRKGISINSENTLHSLRVKQVDKM